MANSTRKFLARYVGKRDAEAFRELVELHQDMVYAACHRVLGNAADAEDAAQSCFLSLARKPEQVKDSLAGWLHRTAVHASLDLARRDRSRRNREVLAMERKSALQSATWDDVAEAVDEAIDQLPDDLRIPVIRHYLQRYTQEEIARELKVTHSAISKRLKRGVETLRTRLSKSGVTLSVTGLGALLLANTAEAAPITLTAALGKMALAGSAATAAGGTAATGTAATIGGVGVKATIASLVGAGLVTGTLIVHSALGQKQETPVVPVSPASAPVELSLHYQVDLNTEQPVAKGQRVIWLAGKEPSLTGLKALPDTPENRKSVIEEADQALHLNEVKSLPDYTALFDLTGIGEGYRVPTAEEIKKLNEFGLWPTVPPEENAIFYYAKASKALLEYHNQFAEPPGSASAQGMPFAGDAAGFVNYVLGNSNVLQTVYTGLAQSDFQPLYLIAKQAGTPTPQLDMLASVRNLVRFLTDAGFAAELQRDPNTAAERYLDCIRIGSQMRGRTVMIANLLGITLQSLGQDSLERLLANSTLDRESLERIIVLAREAEATAEGQLAFLHGEAGFAHATMAMSPQYAVFYGNNYDELFAFVEKEYAKSRCEQLRSSEDVVKDARARWPSLDSVIPSFLVRMPKEWGRADLNMRVIQIRAAIALYQKEHGDPPDDLAALVPDFLPEVPEDPFAGEPFHYVRDGENWNLWSVGYDLKDDGGMETLVDEKGWIGPDFVYTNKIRSNIEVRSKGAIKELPELQGGPVADEGEKRFPSEFDERILAGPQLTLNVETDNGTVRQWKYRHYAEFDTWLAAMGIFGRAVRPDNEIGFNMSAPRDPDAVEGALSLRCRTEDGREITLSIGLRNCALSEWVAPRPDCIETTYLLVGGGASAKVRRTAALVDSPHAPGGSVIQETFAIESLAKGLQVVEFSEYLEADDSIEPERMLNFDGTVLFCLMDDVPLPFFAQCLCGDGWTVGEKEKSGSDNYKSMWRIARKLPMPVNNGVLAESVYIVSKGSSPEGAKEEILTAFQSIPRVQPTGRETSLPDGIVLDESVERALADYLAAEGPDFATKPSGLLIGNQDDTLAFPLRGIAQAKLLAVAEAIFCGDEPIDLAAVFDARMASPDDPARDFGWARVYSLTTNEAQKGYLHSLSYSSPDQPEHAQFFDFAMSVRRIRYRDDIIGLLRQRRIAHMTKMADLLADPTSTRELIKRELSEWGRTAFAQAIAAVVNIEDEEGYQLLRDNWKRRASALPQNVAKVSIEKALPGSKLTVAEVVGKENFAFAAVCEAHELRSMEVEEDNIGNCRQGVAVLELLVGDLPVPANDEAAEKPQ